MEKTRLQSKNTPASENMSEERMWEQQKEVSGGYLGLKIVLLLYRLMGNFILKPLLYTIITCYFLCSKHKRCHSLEFLKRVQSIRAARGLEVTRLSPFLHFLSFGLMLTDKMKAWQGDLHLGKDVIFSPGSYENFYRYLNEKRGKIFICSHLGNVEALRAIGSNTKERDFEVYSVVFLKNARNYARFVNSINPDYQKNLIATDEITPKTSIYLKEKIDAGHAIAIVADRTPVNYMHNERQDRVTEVEFLGRKTLFPQGAFILASVLKCPVQLLFGLKNEKTGKIEIVCENFMERIDLNRKTRDEDLKKIIIEYARILEKHTLEHPYEWFNFY